MRTPSSRVLLLILDGFGEGKKYPGNAIALAKTPTLDHLRKSQPEVLLKAAGLAVGIPEGTQGGSEVGHFTIGAGRVVFQALEAINQSILDGSFYKNPTLIKTFQKAKEEKRPLHLLGMTSDQGVHSDISHLFALLELAKRQDIQTIFIHAITDGRDVPEHSAAKYIQQIQEKIHKLGLDGKAKIATMVGRYYAMDRDSNWNRLGPAYDLYTLGKGVFENDAMQAIQNAYRRGIETDYYIDPIILERDAILHDGDPLIVWNFRSDRVRQITWSFTGETDPKTGKTMSFAPQKIVRPYVVCFGPFSHQAPVLFPTPVVKNNLGEVVASHGLKQLRIGETQKYPHVTYFLNSQIETPFPGEDRIMVESKKCHSYAETPEMNAAGVTEEILKSLPTKKYDLIAVNFANCDLVGHSGSLPATIKSVETIDACLARILPAAKEHGYTTVITGDHGNAEYKIYEESQEPCPSHTKNPVPLWVVGASDQQLIQKSKTGELKDVAPTILNIMGLPKPAEMTGESLYAKKL